MCMFEKIKVNLSSCDSQEAYLHVLTLPPGRVQRVIYTVCRQRGLRFTANSSRVAWSDVRLWPITLTVGRFMTVTAILLPLSLSVSVIHTCTCPFSLFLRTCAHTHTSFRVAVPFPPASNCFLCLILLIVSHPLLASIGRRCVFDGRVRSRLHQAIIFKSQHRLTLRYARRCAVADGTLLCAVCVCDSLTTPGEKKTHLFSGQNRASITPAYHNDTSLRVQPHTVVFLGKLCPFMVPLLNISSNILFPGFESRRHCKSVSKHVSL